MYFPALTSKQCKVQIEKPCYEISIDQFVSFCCSPHSPETLNTLRHQLHVASNNVSQSHSAALSPNTVTGQSSPSVYFGLSRRGSLSSVAGMYCVIAWKTRVNLLLHITSKGHCIYLEISCIFFVHSDSVDATHATPKFVKDTSKYWYKPNISREEGMYRCFMMPRNKL